MSILTVKATKPTPNSKVGISFVLKTTTGKIQITAVSSAGLFASSKLRVGQEIIDINGTSVTGMSTSDVVALLGSIPKDIKMQVREIGSWRMIYNVEKTQKRSKDGRILHSVKTKYQLNCCTRKEVPPILAQRDVSLNKWEHIYDSVHSDLLPALLKSDEMDRTLKIEMGDYTQTQMVKGFVGFGQESHHERKVLNMVHQCAVMANNATLAATNSIARANVLLNQHGIMAQLVIKTEPLPKYSTKQRGEVNNITKPCGLEFLLM